MKLNNTSEVVEVHGGSSRSSFSIAMNGKAFRVLSDTLYQNKIGSIVREISCNAYDAHIAANKKDTPFVIHLPDAFEPWFSVQDFGTGMSPDEINSVFTVYFQSTKDMSNDAIGAFGIGAKTPFSYTDQFTVTSVKDGQRRMYSAFIDESGVPNIIEMSSGEDAGSNGVEIKMSVKPEDYHKFLSETATQLKFFAVKPIITNRSGFVFSQQFDDIVFQNDKVRVSRTFGYQTDSAFYAVQGVVGYPVNIGSIRQSGLDGDNNAFLEYFGSGVSVAVQFPIGDIDVTASRESLQYTKHTLSSINNALTAVRADLTEYVNLELNSRATLWEKAAFLGSDKAIGRLAQVLNIELDGDLSSDRNGVRSFSVVDTNHTLDARLFSAMSQYGIGRAGNLASIRTNDVSCSGRVAIMLRDTGSKYRIRLKYFLDQDKIANPDKSLTVYLVDYNRFEKQTVSDVMKALEEKLGGYKGIRLISEIVPPKTKSVSRESSPKADYYVYNVNALQSHNGSRKRWIKRIDDIATIPIKAAYIVSNKITTALDDNSELIEGYGKFAGEISLICIRKDAVKTVIANSNLVPLSEYLEKRVTETKNDIDAHRAWKNLILRNFVGVHVSSTLMHPDILGSLESTAPDSKVTKMLRICSRIVSRVSDKYTPKNLRDMASIAGWHEYDVLPSEKREIHKNCMDKIFARYPLLQLYGNVYNVRNMVTPEHLAKYVSVI